MTLSLKPALEFPIDRLAQVMNAGFEDYLVPIQLTTERMARLLLNDGVDLQLSQVAVQQDEPTALGLIAQRGWISRLAAMGVSKEARGTGIGTLMMERFIEDAKQRGDRSMVLEVIEQNTPAVKLYQKMGFKIKRRLIGFSGVDLKGKPDDNLQQINVPEVTCLLHQHGPTDLPWQVAPEAFANTGGVYQAYRLNQAVGLFILFPEAEFAVIQSLVVPPEYQRQGQASKLLQALIAAFPNRTWRAPIVFPEELAPGFFEKNGFEKESLSQFQMELRF